jgi:hypothetical protein
MNPAQLEQYLDGVIQADVYLSTMLWGPPGIGKSSIVRQIADRNDLEVVDVRLSQLAPTDLRGLPVAEEGLSRWYPPEFLPRQGRGILFLDEFNMAPPAMQGLAQQLILDRQVGSYTVPEGWFIWAAGNRREDRAAVFEMPAPVANRFLHVSVEPHFDSLKRYAFEHQWHEHIVAFLSFRPSLMHHPDPNQPAWPSPRSWEMADELYRAGLAIDTAVGAAATAEFEAYVAHYESLPELEPILAGEGDEVDFPDEPSVRYAVTVGLTTRADDTAKALHAFRWLSQKATAEWVQVFATDIIGKFRSLGELGALATMVEEEPEIKDFLRRYREMMTA